MAGDLVMKRNFMLSNAFSNFNNKLTPKYSGPFVVSPWTYELCDRRGKSIGVWHAKDLKADPSE